jgi:universal stress protein E
MIWRHVMFTVSNVDYVPTNVVDRVGRIARGLQAEVELFCSIYEPELVQPGHHEEPIDAVIAERVESAHRRLERRADMLREQGVTARSAVRWDYPVYEAVVRQVLRHRVDLLVVPARGMGDVGRLTLHYREARLIEVCPCPLLLLKTAEVYSKGCVIAAVDPLHAYEVPEELDDSIVAAAKTLSYALADVPVHLYHADAAAPDIAGRVGAGHGPDSDRQRTHRARVHTSVRDLADRHNIRDARVHIESGEVENSLPAFAQSMHADAVVMGSLSRTYALRTILGHKAEQVLDAVGCDVLVIKPPGFKCAIERNPAPAVPVAGLERKS